MKTDAKYLRGFTFFVWDYLDIFFIDTIHSLIMKVRNASRKNKEKKMISKKIEQMKNRVGGEKTFQRGS